MNKNQVNGTANEVAGKVQKEVGKATANGTQTVKGAVREVAGKAEKAYGNAKEDIKDEHEARQARDRDIERHAR